jgi:hypothetical protein
VWDEGGFCFEIAMVDSRAHVVKSYQQLLGIDLQMALET